MNITLGIRAIALLAFVAAATALIVQPGVLGLESASHAQALNAVVAPGQF